MPKILVAGISEKHSSTIPDVLRMAGYEVLETADSRTAFQFVLEHAPALIVAKSNLPHLDGLGFLHIIRKHAQFALTPLIFLFETEGWDEVRRMMTAGADDFLFTTCTDAELLYVVESRLKRVALVKDFLKQSTPVPEAGSALQERQVMEELLQGRNLHRYGKSQLIYSEGQSPKFLFYIKNGKVRLLKSSTDGKDLVTDLCGEGDFIGHTALIQNTHYRESAESIDGAELILVPRSEFQQLLRGNINFSYKINMILANALTSKNSHLVGIAYHSLRQKVAEALLLVKRKYAPAQQENFAIQMNREVLANIAGTAKESLIRTLSEFKTERLIEVGVDGHIRIVNEKKLQLLAE